MRIEPALLFGLAGHQLQPLRHPFSSALSGDDGIRTRGLRLAKALLSR